MPNIIAVLKYSEIPLLDRTGGLCGALSNCFQITRFFVFLEGQTIRTTYAIRIRRRRKPISDVYAGRRRTYVRFGLFVCPVKLPSTYNYY